MKLVLFVCAVMVSGWSFAAENQNHREAVSQANTQSVNSGASSGGSAGQKNTPDPEVSMMNPCQLRSVSYPSCY